MLSSLEEKQVLFISESTQVPRRGVVEKDFKLSRQKNVVHQEPDPWKIQGGLPHLPHLLLGHQGENHASLALPPISRVTLGQLLYLSEPQFPSLQKESIKLDYSNGHFRL